MPRYHYIVPVPPREPLPGTAGMPLLLARRLGIHYANPGAWDIEMAFDGVHYSEEGHRVFALRMQDTLESISSHTMP